ncbi:hypothetical protein BDR03DRAFT_981196 [Suillus americanus]|nr:hypothetical protein BDR03DRAFT_981196 [Suillus americanus]
MIKILGRLPEDIKIAENLFHRNVINTPYYIRQAIHTLKMKDSADASNFIGQHVFLRERLLAIDVYADDEAVFCLLLGLPATPVWQQFKSGLIHRISWDHDAFVSTIISTSSSTQSNPLAPHTFESCAARIIAEASRLVNMQTIASSSRPESEEGQAPWQCKKKKKLTDTAAVSAATSVPATIPAFATPANPAAPITLISYASTESTFSPLIPSPPNTAAHRFTIIRDREFFWSYSTTDPVTVRTANGSHLAIPGRGDCVAWLDINVNRHRIRLANCLHAPDTMVNILSVGRMITKGWGCNFRCNPPRCELVYRGTPVGDIPMSGGLFSIDLTFIRPGP